MGKTRLLSFTLLGLFLLGCVAPSRIELPEPTGKRASDHAAVAEAFERVEPGGTIAFGAGTYLVGSEGLVLRTPGVTLQGHPDGSTLVGCTAEERADLDFGDIYEVCNGFMLAAEEQRVTGLRFESFNAALYLPEPTAVGAATQPRSQSGSRADLPASRSGSGLMSTAHARTLSWRATASRGTPTA